MTRGQPNQPPGIAPFFVEEVRKHLEREYGAKVLYESGLSVTTTLDATLQEAANAAVERGLRRLDKRHGYRRPRAQRPRGRPRRSTTFTDDRWNRPIAAGDIVPAVVVTAPKTGAGAPPDRPLPGRPGARGLRLDAPHVGGATSSSRAI